jgi:hypothetical protein
LVAAAVFSTLISRHGQADFHLPKNHVTLGPTFAYAYAPELEGAFVYGVDAAAAYAILWAGGGVRVFETFEADERTVLPYLEVGLWLFVNVGGGYTVDTSGRGALSGPHFFIGVPIPAIKDTLDGLIYVEPYYRATYAEVGTLHEGGAFVKWATFD